LGIKLGENQDNALDLEFYIVILWMLTPSCLPDIYYSFGEPYRFCFPEDGSSIYLGNFEELPPYKRPIIQKTISKHQKIII
jgi:hypothetical protein